MRRVGKRKFGFTSLPGNMHDLQSEMPDMHEVPIGVLLRPQRQESVELDHFTCYPGDEKEQLFEEEP